MSFFGVFWHLQLEDIYFVQWLAFRNHGRYSAADYTKVTSERISKSRFVGEKSWNPFEQEQTIKRRRYFVLKLFQGVVTGLAFMHNNDRLHQSLGPASVVLKYVYFISSKGITSSSCHFLNCLVIS